MHVYGNVLLLAFVFLLQLGCSLDLEIHSSGSTIGLPSTYFRSPTLEISEPNVSVGSESTTFVWTVTYKDASTVNLDASFIRLVGVSSGCQVAVQKQSDFVYEVTASGCWASGYLGLVIESGSALNFLGEQTLASALSPLVKVNNAIQSLSASFAAISDMVIRSGSTVSQSVQVNLNSAAAEDVFVDYSIAQTLSSAISSTDHNLTNGSVRIPAGQTSATIDFDYFGSTVGSKTLQVTLQGGTGKGIAVNTTQGLHRRLFWDSSNAGYAQLSAGSYYACGITTDGDLKCWGSNTNGALGIAGKTFLATPTIVDAGQKYIAVAAGTEHTCAITDTKRVKCWGRNIYGELGDENFVASQATTPRLISDASLYDYISVGNGHSCGVTTDGYLNCWGRNNLGQLGRTANSTTNPIATRLDITVLYKSVSSGDTYSCGITTANVLKCWGSNYYGQLSGGTGYNSTTASNPTPRVVTGTYKGSVTARFAHTCAIDSGDLVKCWGNNGTGRLGNNSTGTATSPVFVNGSEKYLQVSVGHYHTCGITETGRAKCWGRNSETQLGGGVTGSQSLIPVLVDTTRTYSKIASGMYFSCAITTDGLLDCWGDGGTLSDGVTTKQIAKADIAPEFDVQSVIAGEGSTCLVDSASRLYCAGTGLLGDGQDTTRSEMVKIDPFETYKSIVGESHFCGITLTGKLKCWGNNYAGQVGNGSTTNQQVPVYVDETETYIKVSIGNAHTCALTKDHVLKCWGNYSQGRLGDPSFVANVLTPQIIDAGEKYISIAAGGTHSCGVTDTKKLKCWGYNNYGEVGDGTGTQQDLPVIIDAGVEYKEVVAGYSFSCALTTAGHAKCFGENGSGQLGTGSTMNWRELSPQDVASAEVFSTMSAKGSHACALTAQEQLVCWGSNSSGALGNGMETTPTAPIAIADGAYKSISVGSSHICGLRTDNKVRCSGATTNGRFGLGNITSKPSPVSP